MPDVRRHCHQQETQRAKVEPGPPRRPAGRSGTAATGTPARPCRHHRHPRRLAGRLANTHDVGDRFAEEARKIHYGEVPQRGIRGKATAAESEALADEGIEVVQLALPDALKGPVQ